MHPGLGALMAQGFVKLKPLVIDLNHSSHLPWGARARVEGGGKELKNIKLKLAAWIFLVSCVEPICLCNFSCCLLVVER